MEKLKQTLINYLESKKESQSRSLLSTGYAKAISDAVEMIRDINFYDFSQNSPTSDDLLTDLEVTENKRRRSINKEDALKVYYYKLGWNRGEYRKQEQLMPKAV